MKEDRNGDYPMPIKNSLSIIRGSKEEEKVEEEDNEEQQQREEKNV